MLSKRCARRVGAMAVLAIAMGAGSAGGQFMTPVSTIGTGIFDASAAEVPAYDPMSKRLFVVNATQGIDVIDLSNPFAPTLITQIIAPGTNSVAIKNGIVAIAEQGAVKTDPGQVRFFDAAGAFTTALATVGVGALPDMLTFTPDGTRVLVANEGEPNSYGFADSVNPEGSVSIIDLNLSGPLSIAPTVSTATFTAFNAPGAIDPAVRVFGPGATVAQDLEPEYITINADGTKAIVGLQEANAFAIVDIATATVTSIQSLGFKDHSLPGNGFDASDRDGPGNNPAINIANWPVFGMYQPDALASFESGGQLYVVSANEGDSRSSDDFPGFNEEVRGGSLGTLDPAVFGAGSDLLTNNDKLNRLNFTNQNGNTDADAEFEELYTFGSRSFSVWAVDPITGSVSQVFDSGDDFEQIIAAELPTNFNASNDNNSLDNRSDNKGPEPEAVVLGEVAGTLYAFVGLERVGGVMVYDMSNPVAPTFVDYINPRDFAIADLEAATLASAGVNVSNPGQIDLGPEGMLFIDAADSPIGQALLVVANEVSGTTTVYLVPEPATAALLAGLALIARRRRR